MQNKVLRVTQWCGRTVALCVLCVLCVFGSSAAYGQSVYENQAPITDTELVSFIKLLPQFRAWAASSKEMAHPSFKDGKADFVYSEAAATWIQTRGFEARRFFSVMGRAAAALYIISEGISPQSAKPKDMPSVSQTEINLVQKYLAQLLEAGSDAPPL